MIHAVSMQPGDGNYGLDGNWPSIRVCRMGDCLSQLACILFLQEHGSLCAALEQFHIESSSKAPYKPPAGCSVPFVEAPPEMKEVSDLLDGSSSPFVNQKVTH